MSSRFQLCYITDRRTLHGEPVTTRIEAAVRAGVDLIQIREKDLATLPLLKLTMHAVRITKGTRTRIMVNDHFDVALAGGADGVHLGRQSLPASVVRQHAPSDFLIGVSCHSLDEAGAAESDGADYIVLGPIFKTPSKAGYGRPLGIAKLMEVAAHVKIPVIALGGINPERVRLCLDTGAAGIAGIRIFQDCKSVEARVRELRARWGPAQDSDTA